ncbi:tRNA (N6-isopentenyl adenosine(37)-C2)-methylthiotransferase MiaB [Thermodesulfobacteriota bacterium]
MMSDKYLYIQTIGCQMNVYDSEQIAKVLRPAGYVMTPDMETADLIIVNTCSVREKAEHKAFSFLGRLTRLKQKKPGLIIGVGGCVAQQEGEKIMERVPHVDLAFGTHAIPRLPVTIQQIENKKYRVCDVEMSEEIDESVSAMGFQENNEVTRFVTIMRGCDNYCAYCVVPYVRGKETSREPGKIIEEIERLVESGVREVTLLGQNVNSYGKKKGLCSFPELLSRVNEIDGLSRIRFTTSHPKDLSGDLIRAFKDLDKLCSHIHLPVQSGSDRVLQKMNRNYTRQHYLEKIDKLRITSPGIAITSDFIVGFPGETGADFSETLDLLKHVEYDSIFAFMYSDRPNVPAVYFADKISEQEKNERLQKLLNLQKQYTVRSNRALIGSTERVLVDGTSKKQSGGDLPGSDSDVQWTGRTTTNKIVNFHPNNNSDACEKIVTGKLVDIRIEKAFPHSLWGKPVAIETTASGLKGEGTYVA